MLKSCLFCGNITIVEKKVEYLYKNKGKFMVVENVPCEECEFCHEQYFEAKVLKKIEKNFLDLNNALRKPKKEIKMAVEDYREF